jgi:1,4-dihydroxy-2-naphthoate octaprenyltransferase
MVGRETVPVLIGESLTRRLGAVVLFLAALGLIFSFIMGWCSALALLLLLNLAYAFVMLWLTRGRWVYSDVLFETIVEGNFVFSQIVAYGAYLAGVT